MKVKSCFHILLNVSQHILTLLFKTIWNASLMSSQKDTNQWRERLCEVCTRNVKFSETLSCWDRKVQVRVRYKRSWRNVLISLQIQNLNMMWNECLMNKMKKESDNSRPDAWTFHWHVKDRHERFMKNEVWGHEVGVRIRRDKSMRGKRGRAVY